MQYPLIWTPQNLSTIKPKRSAAGLAGCFIAAAAVLTAGGLASAAECVSPPDGIVAWWPAEGNALDLLSSFGGTLQGGATADAAGVSGTAFQFNGTSAYVSVPNASALNPANLTVECWVRFDSLDSTASGGSPPGQQYLVFKKNSRTSNFEGYALTKTRLADGDHLQFGVSSAAGLVAEAASTTLVATGVWYHVAGVRGSNFIQLYVNGVLEKQTAVGFPQDYGSRPLFLGSSGETWDHKLAGRLDEVSLYNRALSAGEIAAIYGAGSAAKCKQPRFLAEPVGGTAYWGGSFTLVGVAGGVTPLTYQWQKDGLSLPGATGTALGMTNLRVADSGDYWLVAENAFGSVTSAVASLVVKVADLTVRYSETETQRVAELTIVGVPGKTCGILAADEPEGTNWQAIANLTLNAETNLWYDVQLPSEPRRVYQLVEGPVPLLIAPVITLQPRSQTAFIGMNLQLETEVLSVQPVGFTWFFNGAPVAEAPPFSGASSAVLSIRGFSADQAGAYQVVITNLYGATTSEVATLTLGDCRPLLPGVVGWWPGEGDANDLVGTNHGILRGGATADTNAFIGTGFSFNGTNKYVEIPNAPELNPAELSVECWVRFDNLDAPGTSTYVGQQYLVFKQNSRSSDFEGYVLSKDRTADDIILWEVSSASGQLVRIDSVSPVTTNQWYHLVGVRGSNYIQLYFNGVLEAQTNVNFPQDYGDQPLYFGTSGQAYWDRKLNGLLDEILLYNRALSAEEVAQLYNAGAVSKCRVPRITTEPTGATRYWGGSLTLTSGATGASPLAAQWEKDGTPIPGATNAVLALTNLQPADGGAYVFHATNPYGSVTSAVASLVVKVADLTVRYSETETQRVAELTIVGVPGKTCGILAADEPEGTNWQAIANLTLNAETNLWYDVQLPSEPRRVYQLVEGPVPLLIAPVITLQPRSQTAFIGMNLQLETEVLSVQPVGFTWFFNGAPVAEAPPFSGASSAVLSIRGFSADQAGAYQVVITNLYGATTSEVATLTLGDCRPLLPGVVGWWPGEGDANDLVGTNHGILRGGATADTNAFIGTGFSFNGTNKYVEIPNAPELNPAELSVECWVRFDNLDAPGTSTYVGQQYLVFKQNSRSSDFEGYVLSKDRTADDIILWEVSSASGQLVRIDSVSPVTTNQWYHLVGVRGSNYIQLYFNGVLEAQTNVNFPQDYGDQPLYFGTSGQAYWDRKLNGLLDEILLYNRALSAEEVAQLYNAGAVSKCRVPRITTEPTGATRYWGGSLTLTSGATGASPLAAQWEKDGTPIPGATNAVLALTNLQPADGGAYVFHATNPFGIAASVPARLEVRLADFAASPAITGPEGLFGFSLIGTPGQVLGIQAAPDLSASNGWFGLTNLTLLEGQTGWQDPEPATNAARFYRVVPGPIPVP